MTEQEIDRMIANVKGSFAVEGMELSEASIEWMRKFARGELTKEEIIEAIKEKYTKR